MSSDMITEVEEVAEQIDVDFNEDEGAAVLADENSVEQQQVLKSSSRSDDAPPTTTSMRHHVEDINSTTTTTVVAASEKEPVIVRKNGVVHPAHGLNNPFGSKILVDSPNTSPARGAEVVEDEPRPTSRFSTKETCDSPTGVSALDSAAKGGSGTGRGESSPNTKPITEVAVSKCRSITSSACSRSTGNNPLAGEVDEDQNMEEDFLSSAVVEDEALREDPNMPSSPNEGNEGADGADGNMNCGVRDGNMNSGSFDQQGGEQDQDQDAQMADGEDQDAAGDNLSKEGISHNDLSASGNENEGEQKADSDKDSDSGSAVQLPRTTARPHPTYRGNKSGMNNNNNASSTSTSAGGNNNASSTAGDNNAATTGNADAGNNNGATATTGEGTNDGTSTTDNKRREGRDGKCTLFVGGLAPYTTTEKCEEMFRRYGFPCAHVHIPWNFAKQAPFQYAFVDLANPADVDRAIARFHNQDVDGRELRCEIRSQGSAKDATEMVNQHRAKGAGSYSTVWDARRGPTNYVPSYAGKGSSRDCRPPPRSSSNYGGGSSRGNYGSSTAAPAAGGGSGRSRFDTDAPTAPARQVRGYGDDRYHTGGNNYGASNKGRGKDSYGGDRGGYGNNSYNNYNFSRGGGKDHSTRDRDNRDNNRDNDRFSSFARFSSRPEPESTAPRGPAPLPGGRAPLPTPIGGGAQRQAARSSRSRGRRAAENTPRGGASTTNNNNNKGRENSRSRRRDSRRPNRAPAPRPAGGKGRF
ncbi:unnamed protein product [Amoebophrya sp. A25]|nr:unnamed protein product [Amoebophrya sp. A25]|eukprot:GSA25T00021155001.1